MNFEIKQLFDLFHTQAADYLSAFRYPWEALDGIKQMILNLGEKNYLPTSTNSAQRASGCTKRQRYSRALIWEHRALSARRLRCATVRLSEALHL